MASRESHESGYFRGGAGATLKDLSIVFVPIAIGMRRRYETCRKPADRITRGLSLDVSQPMNHREGIGDSEQTLTESALSLQVSLESSSQDSPDFPARK